MKKILIVILVCFAALSKAQQLPMYSQYLTNDFILNPAIAGSKPYFPVQINVRSQWAALGAIAPQTNTLSYHMPVAYDEIGIGAILMQDQTGPYSQFGVNLSFAYHIQLDKKDITRLSFGLSGVLTQHTLNQGELSFHNPDPEFEGGTYSKMVPDANFGAYLYSDNFSLGLSAHQLFESTFKESITSFFGDNSQVRHYFALASYRFDVYSDLAIEPSILAKTTESSPIQFDLNTKVTFDNSYWVGLSLRSSQSVVVLGGLNLGQLFLSYSYDYGVSSLSSVASGSHELSLGFNINDKRKRRHSYYW
ncbi:type IX secretion system membrane protein PorP/SprF [Flavobacteriales bacterium]|nr:type IX secretion system membrane protein PorP/SprF [Flavobacteriales bacterium]